METEVKVSVLCTVYNHEKFLEKALESFVNQKTNFKFEIIVHDDASTDKSKEIIKNFHEKYSDIIVPIYQTENQYSKGIHITNTIITPKARGKYVALCEGDDYWCDNEKLQKQYDYMEKNEDCYMCVHNTIKHDLKNEKKDTLFNDWNTIHEMTGEDIFFGWKVHTSSFFIRREIAIPPKFAWKYWFGDYVRLTTAYNSGKVVALPDAMSVYNFNNVNGMTYSVYKNKNINKIEKIKEYLIEYNEFTNNKFEADIKKKINESEINILLLKSDEVKNLKEYKAIKKELKSNEYFSQYINNKKLKDKIKLVLKYENYIFFLIIKLLKKVKMKKI